MKITTRLKLAQLACIAILAIVGLLFAHTTTQMRQEIGKEERAAEILSDVISLRYLALEYVLHHQPRSELQWQQRHATLDRLLAASHDFDRGGDEGQLLQDLRRHLPTLARQFGELQGVHRELQAEPAKQAILLELQSRLTGAIMNRAQDMIADAEDLARLSRARILAVQRQSALVTALLGALILAVVVGAMLLTIRSVARPLARLHRATEVVGAGRLERLQEVHAADEIGDLARSFDQMVGRLQQTTVSRDELIHANAALQEEARVRLAAEQRVTAQLERMSLLHQITRSIGERQDLRSIFQVVVRSLEDQLPVAFGAIGLYDGEALQISCVGVQSRELALQLAMGEAARVAIDANGLSRCVRGELVYEPELRTLDFPFPRRLAQGGLASAVLAPLLVEGSAFGVLVLARRDAHAFSSADCEFLRQLSEHVALAANQARLYGALQQAYDDLHQSQLLVARQERLRALGQMASGIAHDINNAISPIGLYAESLQHSEPGLTENGRACLQVIERAIDDVAATVARMREFYRQREPQVALSTVNANLMVKHVLELTRARWSDMPQQRGIVIAMRQELDPELPAILGVEGEIREALTNLVFNAVDALPDGGGVTLRTRYRERLDDDERPHVLIEVSDTGTGMDEATQRRCLEPFFTTKGERGTGLGLATVYGMAERHGARVTIESRLQHGTTVRLAFPVAPSGSASPVLPDTLPPAAGLAILIVDDDPTVLASLADILRRDGHQVTAADGGQAGIDRFREAAAAGAPFTAVITDLGMPYVDGRKVAETIKAQAPATPVILLTGWGQRIIPETGAGPVQVDAVLSKPPKLRELREALHKCVALGVSVGA